MYYVYILKSRIKQITYTGYTTNIEKRLKTHSSGSVKATKLCRPYELVHIDEFFSAEEAKAQESYYKSTSGRRKIRKMLRLAKKI